jgi:glycosyltransferase involved in cell wall biosynthesis
MLISIVIISKDEPSLDATLEAVALEANAHSEPCEIIVVDASEGRLSDICDRHPVVSWVDYARPAGVRVSIPQQRNVGVKEARGEIVVFTDAACLPCCGWLRSIVAPIIAGKEDVTAGSIGSPGPRRALYDTRMHQLAPYSSECSTLNMAFRKTAFEAIGGFDETFEYGSDIDYSWRLVDAGFRIRMVPEAVIAHDWGSRRRQTHRTFLYGRARARLYLKHGHRLKRAWRTDPVVLVYPAFLLGLPVTWFFPLYPALLAIPALRNRRDGAVRVIAEHLIYGLGVLAELVWP